MATKVFLSSILKPVQDEESSITIVSDDKAKASSFYLDSSGRSSISLPLRLQFPSAEALHEFQELTKFEVPCTGEFGNTRISSTVKTESEVATSEPSRFSLSIEAKITLTFGSGEAVTATVEGVSVITYKIDGDSVFFDTEILMLVSRKGEGGTPTDESFVKTNLEVTVVLSEKKQKSEITPYVSLDNLSLGGFRNVDKDFSRSLVQRTRLNPITLLVSLTHAFSITTRSISGTSMGRTLVAINICHSNTHNEKVVISNITLHPGNSQQYQPGSHSAYEDQLYDMSNNVRWSFVKECSVNLPLILKPQEIISTVILIEATKDEYFRRFRCPISVSGTVGSTDRIIRKCKSIAASEVEWTTTQAASESSEAFRVDMDLQCKDVLLGSAFAVALKISNISGQKRDIRLELLPDAKPANSSSLDGTRPGARGQGTSVDALIPIDSTVSLGELGGKTQTEVVLRFIPTKPGTLLLPRFALVDCRTKKEYHCVHNFKVVVRALQ
jgi:hypothetical protein